MRGVGDVVVAVVGQRHVAGTELVVALQRAEILADHITVLDADGGHQLASGVDALYIIGRVRQFDQVGVHFIGHPVDRVEFRHRVSLGLGVVLRGPLGLADEDDEKARVQAAGAHLLQVDLARSIERINRFGGKVQWNVVVTIDGHHRFVDGLGTGIRHLVTILRRFPVGTATHYRQCNCDYPEVRDSWVHGMDPSRQAGCASIIACRRMQSRRRTGKLGATCADGSRNGFPGGRFTTS